MKKTEREATHRRRDFLSAAVAAAAGASVIMASGCDDGGGGDDDKDAGAGGGSGSDVGRGGSSGDASGGGSDGQVDSGVVEPDAAVEPPCLGRFEGQDDMAWRWGFAVDLGKCIGCESCSVACKTENDVRLRVFRSSVRTHESGDYPDVTRTFVPWLCNQCKCPPCIKRCPVDPIAGSLTFPDGTAVDYQARATFQRPDGLVLIDQERCTGCGRCVVDCPYGARYLDPVKAAGGDETQKAADKCTLCIHRLEHGIVPACVNTCQSGARLAGNLNDPESEISRLIADNDAFVLKEDAGTEPAVYYIGTDPNEAFTQGDDVRVDAQIAFPEHHQEVE